MIASKHDPSLRRRRALTAAVLILLMTSAAAIDALVEHSGAWRLVDYARLAAMLLLALVISLRATSNFSFLKRAPELDDELTRANRASAATWGYWGFFIALLALYGATLVWPLNLRELTPAVLVCGAAIAGLRFVALERRGE